MSSQVGFCVLYRVRLHAGKEDDYIQAWSRLTRLIRSERGGLGSCLHRGEDGIWYAYAQWPSAQARADAFAMGPLDPVAEQQMADSVVEYLPEIRLEPVEDLLLPSASNTNG